MNWNKYFKQLEIKTKIKAKLGLCNSCGKKIDKKNCVIVVDEGQKVYYCCGECYR